MYVLVVVFFFKQKTAYEMRISDWSSDVCSADLLRGGGGKGDAVTGPATVKANPVARLGRSDRTPLGRWFWTIDRVLLLLIFVLMCIGLIAVAAASPAAAYRYSGGAHQLGDLHYFKGQLRWVMRSEEHTSELQSLMRISSAVFCLI